MDYDEEKDECAYCDGDGYMIAQDMPGFDLMWDSPDDVKRCPYCHGKGVV